MWLVVGLVGGLVIGLVIGLLGERNDRFNRWVHDSIIRSQHFRHQRQLTTDAPEETERLTEEEVEEGTHSVDV